MTKSVLLLMVLAALCMPAVAVTDALDVGLRKCAGETDQTRRLACFDALAAALPKVEADKLGMTADIDQRRSAAARKAGAPAAASATNPAVAAHSSGPASPTAAASLPASANPANLAQQNGLTAKIVSVRENARGLLIFALDNDQVWIQDQPSRSIRFAAGETVRIEHGALTSLWLAADHGRKTRVKRLS